MGIARATYRLLLEEKKKKNLSGSSILQLGRQNIFLSYSQMKKFAKKHGVELEKVELTPHQNKNEKRFVNDKTFFRSLGFNTIDSIDYSNYEGAQIIWDLNHIISEKYWGKYDVIFDGGTSEHIFNFPKVLENIHLLLKPNGIIIHLSPSHNHVDHGFYMFSPTVFSDFYRHNNYEILTSYIFEYSFVNKKKLWDIYAYTSGCLEALSFGGFGKKLLGVFFVAKKNANTKKIDCPQQFYYQKTWSKKNTVGFSWQKELTKYLPTKMKTFLKKILPRKLLYKKPKKVFRL